MSIQVQQPQYFNVIEETIHRIGKPITNVKPVPGRHQLLVNGQVFTRSHINKYCTSYRCNQYRPLHCTAQVRHYPIDNSFYENNEHNHPLSSTKPATLTKERKIQIRDWLISHEKYAFKPQVEQFGVNSLLSPKQLQDPTLFASLKHIEAIRREFNLYHEQPLSIQQICDDAELSKTIDHHPFLRLQLLYPTYVIMYMGHYASDYIASADLSEHQFYLFSSLKTTSHDLFTLSVRKHGTNRVIPLIQVLLQDKSLQTYETMWYHIQILLPRLAKESITISLDFSKTMHQAIKKVMPLSVTYGSLFYLKRILMRAIETNGWMVDEQDRTRFWEDFNNLATQDGIDFDMERFKFLAKFPTREHDLRVFLSHTFLSDDASFPPSVWAKSCLGQRALTDWEAHNDYARSFRNRLSDLVKASPTLNQLVRMLRDLEHKSFLESFLEPPSSKKRKLVERVDDPSTKRIKEQNS
jgi:hypothetical protein